jgi:stage III sporulation protein SpoIIIAA
LSGRQITDDLELLLAVMPPRVREGLAARQAEPLIEIVLDLGRLPEARYPDRGEEISTEPVARDDIAYVVGRVGQFGKDNRAGIARTLHRISALRNRVGEVIGLTCRVGRAVFGTVDILRDVIAAGESILLLGRPGVGKTTLLREAARVLADEYGKRVIVVDTSNEIAGDGDIPHPGIGRARRMQVPSPDLQHAVMIEAVENHMPEVIVIDEIGTTAEAMAARTIAERGVQLIATAHGNTLENLLQNPTLSDLIGGIQAVTLSDEEARRRGTQKTVLERRAPPTFDVLIEIQDQDRLAVHHDVAEVVDRFLREVPPRPELRTRKADGEVEIRRAAGGQTAGAGGGPGRPGGALAGVGRRAAAGAAGIAAGEGAGARMDAAGPGAGNAASARDLPPDAGGAAMPGSGAGTLSFEAGRAERRAAAGRGGRDERGEREGQRLPLAQRSGRKMVRIHPYAVSKSKLERAIRKYRAPAYIVEDLDAADMVVTLKAQERRQPRRLRDAVARGLPVHVVKSNTIVQMENFLRAAFAITDPTQADDAALREVEEGVEEVLDQGHPVELPPRNTYLRRLQHQVVERCGLVSESKGEEPYRRVVIYPG